MTALLPWQLAILLCACTAVVAHAQIHFDDFASARNLHLAGDATVSNDALSLTPAKRNKAGAGWFTKKQPVSAGFETTFKFRLTAQGGFGHGADGFAFVLQNAGPQALGGRGSAGGFAVSDPSYHDKPNAIPSSIAVFFDTFKNGNEKDPSDNYIGLCTYGRADDRQWPAPRLAATPKLSVRLRDQHAHTARIRFQPPLLSVFLDDSPEPVLTSAVDLALVADPQGLAWVGFTASTGGGYQNHEILDWSFSGVDVSSSLSVISSQITFHLSDCLPGRKLCTPQNAIVERRPTGYHVVLPAQLEWNAYIPNPTAAKVAISNTRGLACWEPAQTAASCSGPTGNGRLPDPTFVVTTSPAGALIWKNEAGQTWFSLNGHNGAFKQNEGFYEFDVAVIE